jgi:hypothetical protein
LAAHFSPRSPSEALCGVQGRSFLSVSELHCGSFSEVARQIATAAGFAAGCAACCAAGYAASFDVEHIASFCFRSAGNTHFLIIKRLFFISENIFG